MEDEFTHWFKEQFPAFDSAAGASLEAVAEALDLEIAAIEARHAQSRRIAVSKGVQTWVPDVENASAEWSYRQIMVLEADVNLTEAPSDAKRQKLAPSAGKKLGARGGGGGAWRAFVHERGRGERLTKAVAQRLSAEYRALTEEEFKYFDRLGRDALMAWRHGFPAFGEHDRQSRSGQEQPTVGDIVDNGAIVAADARPGPLVAQVARDFALDMSDIRAKFRDLRRRQTAQEERDKELLVALRREAADNAPQWHDTISCRDYGCRGAVGADKISAFLTWFPPCSQFAKAPGGR